MGGAWELMQLWSVNPGYIEHHSLLEGNDLCSLGPDGAQGSKQLDFPFLKVGLKVSSQ